ncbi:lipoprotein LpqH [Microbacterium gubbeenense]|uniref:lipoprotein LpqH n=1 Tax=Microbacterium gubbeenense TaxID=159896 RepID=UPI003F9B7AF6
MTVTTTTISSRIRATALAVGVSAILLLTGCSSSGADAEGSQSAPETATESESSTATDDGAATEEDAGDEGADATEEAAEGTSGGSAAEVSIDGSPVEIADATVVCQDTGGAMTIAVGSTTGTDGIGAVLEGETVKSVALGSVDGTAMGWAEGTPGEVTATVDGSTYTIAGEMMAVDAANPTAAEETPFEMRITCP